MSTTEPTSLNQTHYYPDGDIIIIAESVKFRVHKNVLSLASTVFKDMFEDARPSHTNNDQTIPEINLGNESSETFENVLSYLYPCVYMAFDWNNISEMLRIADKFMMDVVLISARIFMMDKFKERPLLVLELSEKYGFNILFKESSKLVLDDFIKYKKDPIFQKLTLETELSLFKKHHEFIITLYSLNGDKLKQNLDQYEKHCRTKCGTYTNLSSKINDSMKKLEEIMKCDIISPSEVQEIICPSVITQEMRDRHNNLCVDKFYNHYLPKKFRELFGEFEPLNIEKRDNISKKYLFVELEV